MIKRDFSQVIGKFEENLQKIATDVASGVIFERLPPPELLDKTEHYVSSLKDLATKSEGFMLTLKPEKTPTVKKLCRNFIQTLTTFKEILLQDSPDPPANSRLAFEQLRKALSDGSDLLFLMRDVKNDPSPLIDTILTLREASKTKGPVISIKTSEQIQPLIRHILNRIDELRAALMGLEKKVGEMKEVMRQLQEESLKALSQKTSAASKKDEDQNSQLSLSSFKKDEEDGGH